MGLVLAKKARSFDKKSYDKLRYGAYILLTAGDVTSLRDYGYNRRDFLAVMSFLDGCLKIHWAWKSKKPWHN